MEHLPSLEISEDPLTRDIEVLMRDAATFSAEGNNGIIFEIDRDKVSSDIKEDLKRFGIDLDVGTAIKLLKMNTPGLGEQELALQKTAWAAVQRSSPSVPIAKIPRPITTKRITLDDEGLQFLAERVNHSVPRTTDIIIMDFIEAEDLYTQIFKKIAQLHPATRDIAGHVNDMPFKVLEERVKEALGFQDPGGKSNDAHERATEKQTVQGLNSVKATAFLRNHPDVKVHPLALEQLRNTLKCFEDIKFVHRDLHERNVMVVGDIFSETEAPQLYIIDFGMSKIDDGGMFDDDVRYRPDNQTLIKLKTFNAKPKSN